MMPVAQPCGTLMTLTASIALILSVLADAAHADAVADWLVTPAAGTPSRVVAPTPASLQLTNGLLTRTFTLLPAFGTVDLVSNATANHGGTASAFRAVVPEGVVTINGLRYRIGGLMQGNGSEWPGNRFRAYANRTESLDLRAATATDLAAAGFDGGAFRYKSHSVSGVEAPFPWTPGTRHSPSELVWPPAGVSLAVVMKTERLPALTLTVRYEVLDGAPLMRKWVTIESADPSVHVVIDGITTELLGANARFGAYLGHGSHAPNGGWGGATAQGSNPPPPLLHAHTDVAHGAQCVWTDDWTETADPVLGCPTCRDEGAVEPLLNCSYTLGPGAHVVGPAAGASSGEQFVSFKAIVLLHDDTDSARIALQRHRATGLMAPFLFENPVFFHATDVSLIGFNETVTQMTATGFEMLIFSFGSGFVLETADPKYLAKIKSQVGLKLIRGTVLAPLQTTSCLSPWLYIFFRYPPSLLRLIRTPPFLAPP